MSARKLFDSPKKKTKLKKGKAPKRYRHTYNELYNFTDDKLDSIIASGLPEDQDMARGIRTERKRMRLLTYGY